MNDTELKKFEYYINDYYNNYMPNNVSIQEYLDKMNNFEPYEPQKVTLKNLSKKDKLIIAGVIVGIFILGLII